MPRTARIVIPEVTHHCTQRGNDRRDVFLSEDDRRLYLSLLATHSVLCDVRIAAYCLMSNHVHLAAIPSTLDGLSQMMKEVSGQFARITNGWHGRTGHLWHCRFYSCPMDARHTDRAIRYIEMNPWRAALVSDTPDFPWSSAAAHCGLAPDRTGLLDLEQFARRYPAEQWRAILKQSQKMVSQQAVNTEDDELRRATRCGDPQFEPDALAKLESTIGRPLRKFRTNS